VLSREEGEGGGEGSEGGKLHLGKGINGYRNSNFLGHSKTFLCSKSKLTTRKKIFVPKKLRAGTDLGSI